MPWNGSGLFTRLHSWVADKNANIDINSAEMDADTNDIVVGLENCLTLDGQTTPTHNIPMGGFNFTNLGAASTTTGGASVGQVINGSLLWGGTSGGSANTQTIAITPVVTTLVAGQAFRFFAGFTNTGATTLTVNATAATALLRPGRVPCAGGEILANGTYNVVYDGTFFVLASNPVPRGYLSGLALSTAGGSGTFGIAAGVAADSTNASLMALGSAYTKTTSAWAVGSGNGGLDTGAIANTTWYHAYLIERTDTGVCDVLFSLSATTPTMPANYTLSRRLGSMRTDGSAHWLAFWQVGDQFGWVTGILDINVSNLGASVTPYTLTIPTGVQNQALLRVTSSNPTPGAVALFPLAETGTTSAGSGNVSIVASVAGNAIELSVETNTSAQINAVANQASTSLTLFTHGWFDSRGRIS